MASTLRDELASLKIERSGENAIDCRKLQQYVRSTAVEAAVCGCSPGSCG